LLKEVDEGFGSEGYQQEEAQLEEYTRDGYTSEEYAPEDFDPDKPDLELQYLVNEANMMEEGELTTEEDTNPTHVSLCDCEICEDWRNDW